MAYLVELEDDYLESDVPTTVIRSKVECPDTIYGKDPVPPQPAKEKSCDRDMNRKKDKDDRGTNREETRIRDDKQREESRPKEERRGRWDDTRDRREREKGKDARPGDKRRYFDSEDTKENVDKPPSTSELIKNINMKFGHYGEPANVKASKSKAEQMIQKQSTDCYSECYPGMNLYDAIDSDDEGPDYTKMDQGNKKGPLGRWDFENPEEYGAYMNSKEAMPKAAFQFGVKMADGRKTRRVKPNNDRQKLEREWQKISKIIEKRKEDN